MLGYLGNFTVDSAQALAPRRRRRLLRLHRHLLGRVPGRACRTSTTPGMTERKAVYIPYAGALPNAAVVNEKRLPALQRRRVRRVRGRVPVRRHRASTAADEIVERKVGAVIIATGSQLKLETGSAYDLPNVMTTWEFERILNPDGPTGGEIRLPDGSAPQAHRARPLRR